MAVLEKAPIKLDIRHAAQEMADEGRESEPQVREVYLFASASEIRLIYLDATASPSRGDRVHPYYFAANPASGLPYPSAVAVIRPEEKETLSPPEGWGGWSDAERLWPVELKA